VCGIHGLAGNGINQKDIRAFIEFGIVNQVRGTDGSGVFQTNSKATGKFNPEGLFKVPGDWMYWLYTNMGKKQGKLLDSLMCDYIMGHVRWTTSGGNKVENCHPFRHGTIVGAHNGTLRDKRYEHKERTDSDLMFEDISRRGIGTVLRELDKDSAYAITMYDSVSKNFIFARNEQRPIFVAVNTERSVLYWHSDKYLMKAILERCEIKHSAIVQLNAGTVWVTNSNRIKKSTDINDGIFMRGPRIFHRNRQNNVVTRFISDEHATNYYDNLEEDKKVSKELKEEGKVVQHDSASQRVAQLPPPSNQNKESVKEKHVHKQGVMSFHGDVLCCVCEEPVSLIEQYRIRSAPVGTHGYYHDESDDYYCNECVKGTEDVKSDTSKLAEEDDISTKGAAETEFLKQEVRKVVH
jgi:glucosamine 6-phosphate synthetase-like amidotransferase/phosphosugar isomerase protein